MNPKRIVAVAVGLLSLAEAQTSQPARPEFAVASIKPNKTNCCVSGGVGNGGSSNRDVTLKMLMATAYRVQEFQISGGPAWVGSDRFDVEAKAEDPKTDFDELRLMLQSLLEDRFRLKLHRETKESPVYALVAGNTIPPADPSRPSIFAAMQEQLGLRLEPAKSPAEVLVIDHVEQPTAN